MKQLPELIVIKKEILLDPEIGAEELEALLRHKAGLKQKSGSESAIALLASKGLIQAEAKEEPKKSRTIAPMTVKGHKIGTIKYRDSRPFMVKWVEFSEKVKALHKEGSIAIIVNHLRRRLQSIAPEFDYVDYLKERNAAVRLVSENPTYLFEDWRAAVDWFMDDDFWCDKIISVVMLRRHLTKYQIWLGKTRRGQVKSDDIIRG